MNVDIKQLSLDIMRDLFGSSRRLALYPLGHPATQDALKKPLMDLNEIFAFKHSFTVELFRDRMLAEGILIDDAVFVSGIAMEMKKHKLSDIVFYSNLMIGDLYHLLLTLVSKPGPYEDNFSRVMKAKNVTAIAVNVGNPPRLFNFDSAGALPEPGRFELQRRVQEILGDKPDIIARYYMGKVNDDDDILDDLGIDFRLIFLAKFFKEALVGLDKDRGLKLIENAVLSANWLDDSVESQSILGLKRLFDDYLSENKDEEIFGSVFHLVKKVGAPEIVMNQVFNRSTFLKLKTIQESETIVDTLRFSDLSLVDEATLKKTLFKLAASSQRHFIQEILGQLIRSLSLAEPDRRQKAVSLTTLAADLFASGGMFDEFEYICKESVRLTLLPTETLEPVELTFELLKLSLKNGHWRGFKVLSKTMRGVADDKLQAENKRKLASDCLANLTQSDLLYKTASELSEQARSEGANEFYEGLSSLGSKEIIRMLARKLTHPDINIRSRMVKLLAGMKKDSADVLTEMLGELVAQVKNGYFSEEKWYYFRNILRVLKEVGAVDALPYLDMMSSWPQTRLKIEIIKTLEGMPIEHSLELLYRLSKDNDSEVRKAAVIAMGLSGDNEVIPYLHEMLLNDPQMRQAAVASLGRIGSEQARDMLISVFEDKDLAKELGISRRELDEIKATVIRALSVIGDEMSRRKISEYSRQARDKSIFKGDLLSNTAKMILGVKSK